MPKLRKKEVDMHLFVDIEHIGDKSTKRSRHRFMVYMNTALLSLLL